MAFEDIRFPGSKNGKEEVPMMRRVAGGNILAVLSPNRIPLTNMVFPKLQISP